MDLLHCKILIVFCIVLTLYLKIAYDGFMDIYNPTIRID